jgi:hypothetical protein
MLLTKDCTTARQDAAIVNLFRTAPYQTLDTALLQESRDAQFIQALPALASSSKDKLESRLPGTCNAQYPRRDTRLLTKSSRSK